MKASELEEILNSNELTDYDPVAESFKWLDPHGTGEVDRDLLKQIFEELGLGDLSEDDLDILMNTADVDQDQKFTLKDFRTFAPFTNKKWLHSTFLLQSLAIKWISSEGMSWGA